MNFTAIHSRKEQKLNFFFQFYFIFLVFVIVERNECANSTEMEKKMDFHFCKCYTVLLVNAAHIDSLLREEEKEEVFASYIFRLGGWDRLLAII